MTTPIADLAQARRALAALLPHLPEPRLGEWMTPAGVKLPSHGALSVPNVLPILPAPTALLESIGPDCVNSLPRHWLATHKHHQQRWNRTRELLGLHDGCLRAEVAGAEMPPLVCDGVVAGLLLLLVRPRPGKLREALVRLAASHPFGAYLASLGMLLEREHVLLLEAIASDSRLASALCRRDPVAAGNLPERLLAVNDVWAATVALDHPIAQPWLERVLARAATQPGAAVTALALQPDSELRWQETWIGVLLQSAPLFAYEAARWTQWTWTPASWIKLRNRLREGATRDLGCACFHWYRDVEPLKAAQALHNEGFELLWAAELTEATLDFGQALHRRCSLRLKANPADTEARLALRWLAQRGRPHPSPRYA